MHPLQHGIPRVSKCGRGSEPMRSHVGVGAPPIFRTYFSGWLESDVHWGYGSLTHGHISKSRGAGGTSLGFLNCSSSISLPTATPMTWSRPRICSSFRTWLQSWSSSVSLQVTWPSKAKPETPGFQEKYMTWQRSLIA